MAMTGMAGRVRRYGKRRAMRSWPLPLPYERARRHAWSMTHDEALAECARLRREHPDRHRRVFAPRKEADGSWGVVIAEPGGLEFASGERHAETRAGPQVTPDPTETQTPPIHGQRGF